MREVAHVARMNGIISRLLRTELNRNHDQGAFDTTGRNVYDILISKIPILREISMLHIAALSRYRRLAPERITLFPDLHQELFSVDISE